MELAVDGVSDDVSVFKLRWLEKRLRSSAGLYIISPAWSVLNMK